MDTKGLGPNANASAEVNEAERFHDVISLVVYCPDDSTMLLNLNQFTGEYWIPSSKSPFGASWDKQISADIENIFQIRLRPQRILRLCKFWLPDAKPPCIHHVIFELIIDTVMKKELQKNSSKNLNMNWVDHNQLQALWASNHLKSPEMLEYYSLVNESAPSVINIPEEYEVCANILELDEDIMLTSQDTDFGRLVSSARFERTIQETLYVEFLDLCLPCAYLGYRSFMKLMRRLKWDQNDIPSFFRAADFNTRRGLSFREFLYLMALFEANSSHPSEVSNVQCGYIFRFFDTESHGFLTHDDLVKFLRKIKSEATGLSQIEDELSSYYGTLKLSKNQHFTLSQIQDIIKKMKVEEVYQFFRAPASIIVDALGVSEKRIEDALFDMFKRKDNNLLNIENFLAALTATGLRENDPRLKEMMDSIKQKKTSTLDLESFRSVIAPSIALVSSAFKHQFIIPKFGDLCRLVEDLYWSCKSNTEGKVASYIPQLLLMSPDYWGISVCTVDGQRFAIGDVNIPFTIQSVSKPFNYGLVLDLLGPHVVHKYVGQEPSGRNFNEIVLDYTKKPHNPMINAGAILVCSMIMTLLSPEMSPADKLQFVMKYLGRMAGGEEIGYNKDVFESERGCADRNFALGFYMRENNCFPDNCNFQQCMDFYFQCCSLEVTCDNLAIIGSTLANGGICPLTGDKVLKPESVRDVLSLMHSCGMYDYSGQFAFKVGLPSKSGVSGAMLVVIPNLMAIALFSPPLDNLGNSVRDVQFCEQFVKIYNCHPRESPGYDKYKTESKRVMVANLLFSAAWGDLGALKRSKLSNLDMSLCDFDGRTALHLGASYGHLNCVEFLLRDCNVPHDVRDRWGRTPLHEAKKFEHAEVIEFLQEWEARMKRNVKQK